LLGPCATLDLGHRPGPNTPLRLCLLEEATVPAAAQPQPRVARYPQQLDHHRCRHCSIALAPAATPSVASCSPAAAREKSGKREVCVRRRARLDRGQSRSDGLERTEGGCSGERHCRAGARVTASGERRGQPQRKGSRGAGPAGCRWRGGFDDSAGGPGVGGQEREAAQLVDKVGAAALKGRINVGQRPTEISLNFHRPARWANGSYVIFVGYLLDRRKLCYFRRQP
jgi:hypothetical protein